MKSQLRLGIVGVGAIARDHHLPSIADNIELKLVAGASRNSTLSVAMFHDLGEMLAHGPSVDAIVICTPPQTHYALAKQALLAGKHVLLEKPPCITLTEFAHLKDLARQCKRTLYQTWHSQHAHGVALAAGMLTTRKPTTVRVIWKEDVRRWHPGQTWIWEAGGFGVLDPGINAISILTWLIEEPMLVESAILAVPANRQTPIAANARLATPSGVPIHMEFDFRHTGEETWDIEIDTDNEPLRLHAGGALLSVGGRQVPGGRIGLRDEYRSIYRRFVDLVRSGQSETDARPLQVAADIFLAGQRVIAEPEIEPAPLLTECAIRDTRG